MATIILLPTPWLKPESWLDKLYEELLYTGILADVRTATGMSVDRDLIYNVISWRCVDGENYCPAVIVEDDKAILMKITPYADKRYVELYDFREVLIKEIEGLMKHSECDLAGYIC